MHLAGYQILFSEKNISSIVHMCGPGPIFVRTLAIGPKNHDLEMCKNGEVRI